MNHKFIILCTACLMGTYVSQEDSAEAISTDMDSTLKMEIHIGSVRNFVVLQCKCCANEVIIRG